MTDQVDYRKFLESEFKHIRTELTYIKEQTTKTNSRVSHLEDDIVSLKLADVNHVVNCPINPKVDQIKDDLEEYRVMKKYPRLAIILIAVFVCATIFSYFEIRSSQKQMQSEIRLNNELMSSPTRGSHYDPFVNDSIKDSIE
jgi:hypothetical protein